MSIGLHFADGTEDGFGFSYGSESQGPPNEIVRFVYAAVEATESWFQSQKKMTSEAVIKRRGGNPGGHTA